MSVGLSLHTDSWHHLTFQGRKPSWRAAKAADILSLIVRKERRAGTHTDVTDAHHCAFCVVRVHLQVPLLGKRRSVWVQNFQKSPVGENGGSWLLWTGSRSNEGPSQGATK